MAGLGCYRRLIRSFAVAVHRLPQAPFERLESDAVARAGAQSLQELDPAALRDLTRRSRKLLASLAAAPLPDDPIDQVIASVRGLFASWHSESAREYRRLHGVTAETGTGVLIQAMVFGDAGPRSGSGVGCTRDPTTGDDVLSVDFAFNAQGEDVVSGRCAPIESTALSDALPDVWRELLAAKSVLEAEFGDMQEFEFTVEEGQLYFLQSRTGRLTARAAVQIARDMVREGLIDTATALNRVSAHDLANLVTTVLRPRSSDVRLASAIRPAAALPRRVAFDVTRARALAADGPVILAGPACAPTS
jgi:pyruvate,orthophosphate dikinase